MAKVKSGVVLRCQSQNFLSNTDPRSEQHRQDNDPIEAGSFVESDRIEKS